MPSDPTHDQYFTSPKTYKAEEFDCNRFSDSSLAFWVPQFIRVGQMTSDYHILDVGTGTGGYAIALAQALGARVVGFELSEGLLAFARKKRAPSIEWVLGNAESLPFEDESFDRVLMSLMLHQVDDKQKAVTEAFRVLKDDGVLLIRTVRPMDVGARTPFRYFPRVKAVETSRMPSEEILKRLISNAGFGAIESEIVNRNARVDPEETAEDWRSRSRPSYKLLIDDEIDEAISELKREWESGGGKLIDPRPNLFIRAKK